MKRDKNNMSPFMKNGDIKTTIRTLYVFYY